MKEATQRKMAAWWIWVIAASFLLDFGLILRGDWNGPTLGLLAVYNQGSVIVTDVYAHSDTVRLLEGDRIMRAEGQVISSDADWFVILSNLRVGKPIVFEIQRDKQRLKLSVIPVPRWSVGHLSLSLLVLLRIGKMMMLGVACFVAFTRPRNSAALLTALFFAGLSLYNVPTSISGFAAMFHDLPPPVVGLLSIPTVAGSLTPLCLFLFCVTFPCRLIQSRCILALLCVPQLSWLVPAQIYSYRLVHNPGQAIGMFSEPFYLALNMTSAAYFIAGPFALALNYRRLTDINQRRRVQVLVLGSVAGLLALVTLILALVVPPFRDSLFGRMFQSLIPGTSLVILSFLVFPTAFAYAVLRHRLFDVRIIVRRGLQYAMARGVLLSALPLLAAALLLDIFTHEDQALTTVIAARGLTYAAFGSVAAILYWKRQEWLDRIDRRFFRDRYDAQRVLQQVVLDVKEAKSFEDAAGEVVKQVHATLHPEFVSLLHRAADQMELRSIACTPAGHRPPEIPVSGKLMAFLRLVERPVQLSASNPVADALRGEEVKLVNDHRIELLIPVAVGPDRAESVLVLGPKRSEEPYSREDEKLLTAIGASLALLLASTASATEDRQSFQECTECGVCFNTGEPVCSEDGSALVRVYMPRTLAKRYRLERRVGRGGMGAVYSGVDEALDRPIAIKVIRPDLIGRGDVRSRFHQEARAAAGLLHQNVITIYDFGIERQHPFIVMELLSGRTLRAELDSSKRLLLERTIKILDGVCAAIEEAHRRQFLHRDIKPENIFIADTPTGEVVKVLDFGLVKAFGVSKMSSTSTAPGGIAGTPSYMAPEQLLGERAGPSSDIWALGVIAYEMLTGAHPFAAEPATGWQKTLLDGTFTPLRVRQPNFSQEAQSVFEGVFQRDPTRRTASARSFLSALELALRTQDQAMTTRQIGGHRHRIEVEPNADSSSWKFR
jgi:eukaryotic-like serine/threonine-protein kinase